MKYKGLYSFILLLLLTAGKLFAQATPYLIDEFPSVFTAIEKNLRHEEFDTVINSCAIILEKEQNPKIKGIAYFYQGEAATLMNDFQFAEICFFEAIKFFEANDFKKGLAMAYCKQGDLYFYQRDFTIADSLYDQSIKLSKQLKYNEVLADIYQNKAIIYANSQDIEFPIVFLKKALFHARLLADTGRINDVLNQIATNYHSAGQLDSAIVYFQKGIIQKVEMNDKEGLISDYSAVGNLYRQRGSYELAQEYLIKGLRVAETVRDTFSLMTLFSEIGDVHAAQGTWDKAEYYYLESLNLARLKGRSFSEAGCLNKLGEIYIRQDKKETAIEYYEAALQLYEQLNNKIKAAESRINLSKIYKDKNQITKAKEYLQEALAVRIQSADKLSILAVKMALAEIEIITGNENKGVELIKECLPEYEGMEDQEGLKNGYLLLSEAYSKSNKYKLAFQYYQQYKNISDKLTSIERAKAINELGVLYATEKKDKEIAQQKVSIEEQRVAMKERKNQLLLLSGGLILVAILSALLFYVNRKNKQLNQKNIEVLKKEQESQRLRAFIEGEEKERKRLAEELHDGLGAVLATVKMQINSIQRKLPAVQELPTYLKAESLIDDACRTVREISHGLTPLVIEQHGLEYAIADLCQSIANNNTIKIDFIPYGTDHPLDDTIQTTIYRITQEALKNMLKHASAKEVIVQLTIEENDIILIIEDDGKGFDIANSNDGIGLHNIRSRTAYLGGTLDINSIIGEGTTFTINIPLQAD